MIKSIRRFLLINLLLAIIATTILTAIGNVYLDQKDIENHLDILLSQSALSLQAIISTEFYKRDLQQLQQSLNEIPNKSKQLFSKQHPKLTTKIQGRYQFQVWDDQGKLLLHSADAPMVPLSPGKEGLQTTSIKQHRWRTFTIYDPKLGLRIELTEPYHARARLARRIVDDDIYIMLLTYPLAGLLIWMIVGRGLRSIRRVTDEVAHRFPSHLDPVDPKSVPDEIKPLVLELNKLFVRLQEAFEREKRFASNAAHELKTPLAALKTQAEVAISIDDEKARKAQLQKLISGVDRSTRIIQQLLTLSRLDPETIAAGDLVKADLKSLAAEIIATLVPSALEKQIDIELITDETQKFFIMGNITALNILLRNLVDNAIRYTPVKGAIQVYIESTKNNILLRVVDNGPGIPAKLRSRVFERFYRVLGNKRPGSGLGLAIVQQVADYHHASVKLGVPKSGQGLEVIVTFKKTS